MSSRTSPAGELAPRLHTRAAQKDVQRLAAAGLKDRAQVLLGLLTGDPFKSPPPFEKLAGDLAGAYFRRINIRHRLVYEVLVEERSVKLLRMWSHYEYAEPRPCAAALASRC